METLIIITSQQNMENVCHDEEFVAIFNVWNDFLDHLRFTNGDLSSFWISYIDFIDDIILGLIRSSREGNWPRHLKAICNLIPWCFGTVQQITL